MVGRVLCLVVTLLVVYDVQCQNPPTIESSYIAWGEIVQPLQDTFYGITLQSAFEESYDATTKNAAFFLYQMGKNLTFLKNYETNQTYLYVEASDSMTVTPEDDAKANDKPKLRCLETNEKQWLESDIAPGLLSFEDDDGTIKFSLTQLLNIPSKYMMDKLRGVSTTFRDMPAKSWTYEIKTKSDDKKYDATLSIQSYWSDGTWNTSAGTKMAPLGFNVSKIIWSKPVVTADYFINVFGFVPDAYDHKYFEAVQGVVCPNRKSTLKFPNVHNIKAISFHSELASPDYQELRYIDTWFDSQNQIVRVDLERLDDEDPLPKKQRRFQSEIAVGQLGVVFRWGWDKGASYCEVVSFDKYTNDIQNLFDIKQDLRKWQMGKIFGLNETSYVYIGQTTKNDIPCHLFQAERTDWPDVNSKIKSLWEWCFNVNMTDKDAFLFRNGEFGLISANVIILSDPEGYYENYRMNHHFYGVKQQDPNILAATAFDIGKCFRDYEKRALQFYLNIKIDVDNRKMVENATSDVTFLQRWKDAIYLNSDIDDYSLRISNLRSTIDDDKVFIKFSILDVHKDLPEKIKKKQISKFDAEKILRDNVNDGKVSIMYQLEKGKAAVLKAEKHSVSFQIDPKFEPQTVAPLTDQPTPSTFVFSLRTEPHKDKTQDPSKITTSTSSTDSSSVSDKGVTDSSSTTSQSPDDDTTATTTPEKRRVAKYIGHQPGAVAGVAISMMLVGVSIGAGGIFYKYNGLPDCMKR